VEDASGGCGCGNRRPCMKVRTLSESLLTCERGDVRQSQSSPCRYRVRFSLLHWRQHETILGQSPGGISTIPTQILGWNCADLEPVDMEDYESGHAPRKDLEIEARKKDKRSSGDFTKGNTGSSQGCRKLNTRQRIEQAKKAQEEAESKESRHHKRIQSSKKDWQMVVSSVVTVSKLFKKL